MLYYWKAKFKYLYKNWMLLDLFFIIEEKKIRLILPYLKNTFNFLVPSATQVRRKILLSGIISCSTEQLFRCILLTEYQISVLSCCRPLNNHDLEQLEFQYLKFCSISNDSCFQAGVLGYIMSDLEVCRLHLQLQRLSLFSPWHLNITLKTKPKFCQNLMSSGNE